MYLHYLPWKQKRNRLQWMNNNAYFRNVRMAEWSKAPDSRYMPCLKKQQFEYSGPRMWAWVQIPLLTILFFHVPFDHPFNRNTSLLQSNTSSIFYNHVTNKCLRKFSVLTVGSYGQWISVGRNSSVGRALDWRSKGPWFNPGFRHVPSHGGWPFE